METTVDTTPAIKKLYRGKLRFCRTSSDKAGQVLQLIRGKTFYQAKYILTYTPKKASRMILKLLESIAANARNTVVELRPDLDDLYIFTATADRVPPTRHAFRPGLTAGQPASRSAPPIL